MPYSSDFSSVPPASNWAVPVPAATTSPADGYGFQPDASQLPEAVYVPNAPLMQAPTQDIYTPPAPLAVIPQTTTAVKVASSDSYTPSFAESSATEVTNPEEAKPMPFIGNHPKQTALGMGAGALGGALLGGIVKAVAFNEDKDEAKSTTTGETGKATSTKTEAKVNAGWSFTGVHADGKTPKEVTETITGRKYTIASDGKIVGLNKDNTSIVKPKANASTNGFKVGENDEYSTKPYLFKVSRGKGELYNTGEAYIQHTPNIIELRRQCASIIPLIDRLPLLNKEERFLIDKTSNMVLVLNKKGHITKLLTNVSGLNPTNPLQSAASAFVDVLTLKTKIPDDKTLNAALKPFVEAGALDGTLKDKFVARLKNRKLLGIIPLPLDPVTKHTNYANNPGALGTGLQKKLAEMATFDFNAELASTNPHANGFYPDFAALNAHCKFVPESVEAAKKAATEAAKETGFGKFVPFALGGAVIGAAALFGADYFLQRRKPKTVTETE